MRAVLAFFQVQTREDKPDQFGRMEYVLDGGKGELVFSENQISDGLDEVHLMVGNEVELSLVGAAKPYKTTLIEIRSDPANPDLFHISIELPYALLDSKSIADLSYLLRVGNCDVQIVERSSR